MATLNTRLTRLENWQGAAPCPDRWHQPTDATAVRIVDYRLAAAPLMAGYVAPTTAPAPDSCPTCHQERPSISIRALDLPIGQTVGQSLGFGRRLTPRPGEARP